MIQDKDSMIFIPDPRNPLHGWVKHDAATSKQSNKSASSSTPLPKKTLLFLPQEDEGDEDGIDDDYASHQDSHMGGQLQSSPTGKQGHWSIGTVPSSGEDQVMSHALSILHDHDLTPPSARRVHWATPISQSRPYNSQPGSSSQNSNQSNHAILPTTTINSSLVFQTSNSHAQQHKEVGSSQKSLAMTSSIYPTAHIKVASCSKPSKNSDINRDIVPSHNPLEAHRDGKDVIQRQREESIRVNLRHLLKHLGAEAFVKPFGERPKEVGRTDGGSRSEQRPIDSHHSLSEVTAIVRSRQDDSVGIIRGVTSISNMARSDVKGCAAPPSCISEIQDQVRTSTVAVMMDPELATAAGPGQAHPTKSPSSWTTVDCDPSPQNPRRGILTTSPTNHVISCESSSLGKRAREVDDQKKRQALNQFVTSDWLEEACRHKKHINRFLISKAPTRSIETLQALSATLDCIDRLKWNLDLNAVKTSRIAKSIKHLVNAPEALIVEPDVYGLRDKARAILDCFKKRYDQEWKTAVSVCRAD